MPLLSGRSARQKAKLNQILDLDDFDRVVRRSLPRAIYGYVAHGSETETTLRTNRAQFDNWRFVTRNLVGVAERSQEIDLFGHRYASHSASRRWGAARWWPMTATP
jgi:L-lactate dehydrogenase (cytochrome)